MSSDLHKFSEEGDLKQVKRLVKGGLLHRDKTGINEANLLGLTPLHKAAAKGHTDVAAFLVEHGADVNAKVKHDIVSPLGHVVEMLGCSPLSFAAKYGHGPVAALLVEQGADVNVRNYYGWTPLTYAVMNANIEIVQLLLEHGGDVNNQSARSGETPLHLCVGSPPNPEIAALLLDHGADVNIRQHSGETPLDLAARKKRDDLAALFGKYAALQGAPSDSPEQENK